MSPNEALHPAINGTIERLRQVQYDPDQTMPDIGLAIKAVENVGARLRDGVFRPEQACEALFDTYFAFQDAAQDTDAAHALRVAGDDLGMEFDVDLDDNWAAYQRALRRAESGRTAGYSVLRHSGLLG